MWRVVKAAVSRLGQTLRHSRRDDDLNSEIREHLQLLEERFIRQGMTAAEARYAARQVFGGVEQLKEQHREQRSFLWLNQMQRDFKYALRTLGRSPAFTVTVVLILALGFGANGAVFTLFSQIVLRSLPVRNAERLVLFHSDYRLQNNHSDSSETIFSNPMYRELLTRDSAFDGIAARFGMGTAVMYQGSTASAGLEIVSGNFFTLLGVSPAIGRLFDTSDDGAAGAHPVVALSYRYWRSRFAGDPRVLGEQLVVNNRAYSVVGVVAPSFLGVISGRSPDIYVPIAMQPSLAPWDGIQDPRTGWLNLIGRLKDGVTPVQAGEVSNALYAPVLESQIGPPAANSTRPAVDLRPGAGGINNLSVQWGQPLAVLFVAVALVMAVACASIANLVLARASARRQDVAIRLALGAGRAALIRHALFEALIVAFAGGALGLLTAYGGARLLIALLPGQASGWLTSAPDSRVLAFVFTVVVVTSVVLGLLPTLYSTRLTGNGLRTQAATVTRGARRFQMALVAAQIAGSLFLVVGAAMCLDSLMHLMQVNLGFKTDKLHVISIDATGTHPQPQSAANFYEQLRQRLAGLPGVISVGASLGGPLSGSVSSSSGNIEGYVPPDGVQIPLTRIAVSEGYFQTMQIPLLNGRLFSESDGPSAPGVVIINEALARHYFGNSNPVGRHLMWGTNNPWQEIVGVVADNRFDVRTPAKDTAFVPYTQWTRASRMVFYIRAENTAGLSSEIRRIAGSIDSGVPVRDVQTMDRQIEDSLYLDRLTALLTVIFGTMATLLAAFSLYGVISYAVHQRTPEIGIRMALGAHGRDVVQLILRQASVVTIIGVAVGAAGSWAAGRLAQAQLFEVHLNIALVTVAVVLVSAAALTAGFVPARRASKLDPLIALKHE